MAYYFNTIDNMGPHKLMFFLDEDFQFQIYSGVFGICTF